MIRIGIAGIGFMGMVHYLAYQRLRGARVVALCSRDSKRLAGDWRGIRGNFGPTGQQMDLSDVRTYEQLDDLLDDAQIDLIDITLPPGVHAEVAIKALRRGKHVFSEKPMALSVADCDRMVLAAKKTRRQLLIGHVVPFFPEYAWALKMIRSGKYGMLRGGSFKRVISNPSWLPNYWQPQHGGGPMLDLHVHDAHFIRLLFGMPKSVVTRGIAHNGLPKYWHSLFDYGAADYVVEATSGTIDQQGRSFNQGFEIHLERATLAFEFAVINGRGRYLCEPMLLDSAGKAKPARLVGGDPTDAFRAELGDVVACITQNRTSELLGSELARDAVALCNKQTQSLATGRSVRA